MTSRLATDQVVPLEDWRVENKPTLQLGLVDEYRFWLVPAAAGKGVALFTDFTRLCLRSSTAFPSGMLELAYAPAGTGR